MKADIGKLGQHSFVYTYLIKYQLQLVCCQIAKSHITDGAN